MKIRYTKPKTEEVIDFILLAIGMLLVLLQDSNILLVLGILLIVPNINGSLGKISVKFGKEK